MEIPFYVTHEVTKLYDTGHVLSVDGDEKSLTYAIEFMAANWKTDKMDYCSTHKTGNR